VLPVEELIVRAKSLGIICFIDGAHAPGHVTIDLASLASLGCEMYAGNCHKWMCSPKGSAFLWTADAWKDKITPVVVGWGSQHSVLGGSALIEENEFLGTRD